MKRVVLAFLAAAAASCVPEGNAPTKGELSLELAYRGQSGPLWDDYMFSRNVDALADGGTGTAKWEHDMYAGRLRAPVQKAWSATLSRRNTTTSLRYYHLNAVCVAPSDGRIQTNDDTCDPVLAARVIRTGCTTAADNTPAAGLVGVKSIDSYATTITSTGENQYIKCQRGCACQFDVVIANRAPGEALMDVRWAEDTDTTPPTTGSAAWRTSFTHYLTSVSGDDQYVGGAVINVGPLAAGDYLTVETEDGGAVDATRTDLWLVNETNETWATAGSRNLAPPADNDATLQITDARWSTLNDSQPNLLIVSKRSRVLTSSSWSDHQIEVDVRRGPHAATYSSTLPTSCAHASEAARQGCQGASLSSAPGATYIPPGRYTFHVEARADGVGEDDGELGAGDGGGFESDEREGGFCQGGADECATGETMCAARSRGRGNNLAFTLEVRRWSGTAWVTIAQRQVPRALLAANNQTSRVGIEVEVEPIDGQAGYAYALALVDNGVRVNPTWRAERNVDVAELKVAHANHEYDFHASANDGSFANVVDLLIGDGASLDSRAGGERFVHFRRERSWELGADYAQLQEVTFGSHEWVASHLDEDGSHRDGDRWTEHIAWGKKMSVGPDRLNVSFGNLAVDATGVGIRWPFASMLRAGCDHVYERDGYEASPACEILSTIGGAVRWYAMPNQLRVRRLGGAARPVVVVNAYLPHTGVHALGEPGVAASERDRRDALDNLEDALVELMRDHAAPFNASGDPSPLAPDTRMIIMGDLNLSSRGCAEMNAFVRSLRDRFGYALDLGTAQLDMYGRTLDGHYSGLPIDEQLGRSYGSCDGLPIDKSGMVGCTPNFMTPARWDDLKRGVDDPLLPDVSAFDTTPDQPFAWWAGTKASPGGQRLDAIILVGLGWRNDDPLVKYMPLSVRDVPSFANGYNGSGVEFQTTEDTSCAGRQEVGDLGDWSYAPRHATTPLLCQQVGAGEICQRVSCGIHRGAPAIESDHIPIAARLRIR